MEEFKDTNKEFPDYDPSLQSGYYLVNSLLKLKNIVTMEEFLKEYEIIYNFRADGVTKFYNCVKRK